MIPERCRRNGPGPSSPIHEKNGCRGEPGYAQSKLPSKVRNALAAIEGVFDFRETQLQRVIFVLGPFEPSLQLGNHMAQD